MATVKVSQLAQAGSLGAEDYAMIVQDGKTYKVKASVLRDYLNNLTPSTLAVTPTEAAQTHTPADGTYYSGVNVAAIQTEEKSVTAGAQTQTVTPTPGKYLKKVTVASEIRALVVNDETVTPTGTYATQTYYNLAYGVKVGYMRDGGILLSMKGGTTTSYENLNFTLASAPEGVTLTASSASWGTGNPAGQLYVCMLTGITSPVELAIDMSAYNATYDYTTCAITLTAAV